MSLNPNAAYTVYMDLPDETTIEWPCINKAQLRIVTAQVRLLAIQLQAILRVVDSNGKEVPT